MTIDINGQPKVINFLQTDSFLAVIDRIPAINYTCQNVSTPGISASAAELPTPFKDLSMPGDNVVYDDLSFTFIITSDLSNYLAIKHWMEGYTFPESYEEYTQFLTDKKPQLKNPVLNMTSDISVQVLSNKKNRIATFQFSNCFPNSLGGLNLDVTDSDTSVITADVSFSFANFYVDVAV
jgi:hypothetical protein